MEWLVEISPEFSDGKRVADYLEANGKKVHRIQMESPFGPPAWPRTQDPIGYGSVNFCLKMNRQPPVCEGIFDNYMGLRCSNYYNYVYGMLGRTAILLPAGALADAILEPIFGQRVFVRPDASIKEFDGQIVETNKLRQPRMIPALARLTDGLVVLSAPIHIGKEYRVFCRNGEAITSSSYEVPAREGQEYHPAPQDVVMFAEEAAKLLRMPVGNILAVDVADYHGLLRLVEVNGVNSAGLYGCDIGKFVEAMEAEALERRL